jgi:rRNA-processing protein FCF1
MFLHKALVPAFEMGRERGFYMILCDENIPVGIARKLEISHLTDLGLKSAKDDKVLEFIQDNNVDLFITQDKGLTRKVRKTPTKVIFIDIPQMILEEIKRQM